MTLRQKQSVFMLNVARLVLWGYEQGYEMTWGYTYRSPEMNRLLARTGRGIVTSLHGLKLAVDINLFLDGDYLTATEDHRPLGDHWVTLHPLNRWGGRFRDGNHYSMEHGGRK